MAPTEFPDDLLQAQVDLEQTRAAHAQLCRELPWSVEPTAGGSGEPIAHGGYVSTRPDSPGYTEEQKGEWVRLQQRLRELSATVIIHPYWDSITGVVEARARLKQAAREAVGSRSLR